jgi:hypothetical protein
MWGEYMPEINIEQKIQEALKRKSFKDNKLEYITLTLIFCLVLYVTFVAAYIFPILAPFIILFVDIPLLMGYKHFIWFGPASGETLLDGFKVSLICGYLNFISYVKIFITTNAIALLGAVAAMILSESIGAAVVVRLFYSQMFDIYSQAGVSIVEKTNQIVALNGFIETIVLVELISLAIALVVFYIVKLQRAILPYVSFLRLNNLEGKSMEGVITHTKRVISVNRWKYYLNSTLWHLLYIIPIAATVGVYIWMSSNPVYSLDTVNLISAVAFFIAMAPGLLAVELYYRKYCMSVNQSFNKEQNMMLNDALNDLNKNSSNKN